MKYSDLLSDHHLAERREPFSDNDLAEIKQFHSYYARLTVEIYQ